MNAALNLLVLTLTTSEARMTEIARRLDGDAESGAVFLFKAASGDALSSPQPKLLTEPWLRASQASLRIGVP